MECDDLIGFFIDALLKDIGLGEFSRLNIESKLCYLVKIYNENKSTISLTEIGQQLFDCIKPVATDASNITSSQIASCVFLVLLMTVSFIILTAIILMLLVSSKQYF